MTFKGRELDINLMMHEISLACAKIEIKMACKDGSLKGEDDMGKYLDRMFSSYINNFAYLSEKTDSEIESLLSGD